MRSRKLPAPLRNLRLRVIVDDYEGHPRVPPGNVVNALGDPHHPNFLVIELDSPIEVERPDGTGIMPIKHIAVSGYGWELEELIHPPSHPSPWIVKIWHVYDPNLATAREPAEGAMEYVAKGGMTRFIPSDLGK